MSYLVKSKAERTYAKRMGITACVYLAVIFGTKLAVRHMHVTGWALYALALLPVLPVLRMLHVLALYIQEETDEFVRLVLVRSVVCGAAAVLVLAAVTDFLRSFADAGDPPPFALFVVFWLVFGLANAIQNYKNRVTSDEK